MLKQQQPAQTPETRQPDGTLENELDPMALAAANLEKAFEEISARILREREQSPLIDEKVKWQ